jgi:hypothetical protein
MLSKRELGAVLDVLRRIAKSTVRVGYATNSGVTLDEVSRPIDLARCFVPTWPKDTALAA